MRKEAFYGKELILADRDMVETDSESILRDADKEDVALLVVGDPFGYVVAYYQYLSLIMLQCNDTHGYCSASTFAEDTGSGCP